MPQGKLRKVPGGHQGEEETAWRPLEAPSNRAGRRRPSEAIKERARASTEQQGL